MQSLLAEWRAILTDIGVPFRQELSLRQYLSTAKQRLEWQVKPASFRLPNPEKYKFCRAGVVVFCLAFTNDLILVISKASSASL